MISCVVPCWPQSLPSHLFIIQVSRYMDLAPLSMYVFLYYYLLFYCLPDENFKSDHLK